MLDYLASLPPAVAQGIMWGIMAIGVFITYKIVDVADLTVDGSLCTGMAVCAVLITKASAPVWLAILCGAIAGMGAGLITGIFHTVLGIPGILAGILTQLMLWSINLKIMGGAANIGYAYTSKFFVSSSTIISTIIYLLLIVVALIAVLYWFFGTALGASIRATGCNPHMSRAQGINTSVNKVIGFVLSNGIVAFAGAIISLYSGYSDVNTGRGAIVIGLAAIVIGEAALSRLYNRSMIFKLASVIVGGIIYYLVYQTIIYIGLDTYYLKMFSALVVAVFLAIPYLRKKYFTKVKSVKKVKEVDENA